MNIQLKRKILQTNNEYINIQLKRMILQTDNEYIIKEEDTADR